MIKCSKDLQSLYKQNQQIDYRLKIKSLPYA